MVGTKTMFLKWLVWSVLFNRQQWLNMTQTEWEGLQVILPTLFLKYCTWTEQNVDVFVALLTISQSVFNLCYPPDNDRQNTFKNY